MGGIFLSYSRDSEALVDILAKDIKVLAPAVWFDRELSGGQVWWNQILTRIRECDVFVFALTPQSLDSVACRRECDYAAALGKPILPVLLSDGISTNLLPKSLAQIQLLDYRSQDRAAGLQLAKAIAALPPAGPLPDPLPPLPDVPTSYFGGLAEQLANKPDLSRSEQAAFLFDFKRGLGDIATKADSLVLLREMRKRRDVYADIAEEIEVLIAGSTQSTQTLTPVPAAAVPTRLVDTGPAVHPLGDSGDPPARSETPDARTEGRNTIADRRSSEQTKQQPTPKTGQQRQKAEAVRRERFSREEVQKKRQATERLERERLTQEEAEMHRAVRLGSSQTVGDAQPVNWSNVGWVLFALFMIGMLAYAYAIGGWPRVIKVLF